MFPDPITMAYAAQPGISRKQVEGDLRMEPTASSRRGASILREGRRVKLISEIDKAGFQSILVEIRNLA